MEISISGIMRDNDAAYFNYLSDSIYSIDLKAEIIIKESLEGLLINVLPSLSQLRDPLIRMIRKVHYNMNLKIEFSKSLLISKHITFKVKF